MSFIFILNERAVPLAAGGGAVDVEIVVKFGENAGFGAKCARARPGGGNFAVWKSCGVWRNYR